MSSSLFQQLMDELRAFLAPLSEAAKSEFELRELLADMGFPLDVLPATLVDDLFAAFDQLQQAVSGPAPSLGSLQGLERLRDQAVALMRGVRQLSPNALSQSGVHFGEHLVAELFSRYLRSRHPLLRAILVLLTILEPAEDRPPSEPVVDAQGRLVRLPVQVDALHFDRFSSLVSDPKGLLKGTYFPAGLKDPEHVRAIAEKLYPRLARVLQMLGLEVTHGIRPEHIAKVSPVAQQVGAGMMAVVAHLPEGPAARAGVLLALSPAGQGNLGLVVSPFGKLGDDWDLGRWGLKTTFDASVDAFAVSPRGLTVLASSGTSRVDASVTATRNREAPLRLGGESGTRFEVGSLTLSATAALSPEQREITLSLDARSVALVIASEGDGLLKEVLPPEGLRVDFDVAVSWSNVRGFQLSGSAGLETSFPVNKDILGLLRVQAAHLALRASGSELRAIVAATFAAEIGPVMVVVEKLGLSFTLRPGGPDGGALGGLDLALGLEPPVGAGLSIDLPSVSGGGYLRFDRERGQYAGLLVLELGGTIAVKAIGLLTTKLPDGSEGFSLLLIITIEGFAPIALGFGFFLTGVGGLVGIHRTVSTDVLRGMLKTGGLDSVLFPEDPLRNAPALISDLGAIFPPSRGHYLLAPMALITWGTPTLVKAKLAIILELPAATRWVVLGRVSAVLPDEENPVVSLQLSSMGVLDLDEGTASVDATLFDSQIAGMALSGDMAMRARWKKDPSFALSVGGFHPRFPVPEAFPALERMSLTVVSREDLRLGLQSYFAITSNTVQFGARVDLFARAAGFTLEGFLGFDALFQFLPFRFLIDAGAGLAVRRGGRTLMSVTLTLTISGPTPWVFHGVATFSLFGLKVPIRVDYQTGSSEPPPLPEPTDVLGQLCTALRDPRAWSGELPALERPIVVLREVTAAGVSPVHPLAELRVRQRVVPLDREISRFGNTRPSGESRFHLTPRLEGGASPGLQVTALQDYFARAQFEDLREDQKLSLPSFELMDCGIHVHFDGDGWDVPTEFVESPVDYEESLPGLTGGIHA